MHWFSTTAFDLYLESVRRDISETSASDHGPVLFRRTVRGAGPVAHEASSKFSSDQFGLRRMTMKRFITMLSAGAVALVLSNSAMAGTESPVTAAQIQAAKTPADHEAIAAAYDKEAAELEKMAKDHEGMARVYQAAASTQKGMNAPAMKSHCERLATQYKEAAEANRQMAAEHRKMKM
jgi:hypothetical protein